jgi:hypothetical protein
MVFSRRTFLGLFQAQMFCPAILGPSVSASLAGARAESQPKNMTEWMDAWTGVGAREPNGGLFVYRFKDPMWALLKPISWQPNPGQKALDRVDVPAGFVTDFASIPRAFYTLLRPDGEYSYAAIFHDYLYWTQTRSKEESDEIFRLAMLDFNIDGIIVATIYEAVHRFGRTAWDENSRLRLAGEERILVKFPEDPRTTWEEWKKLPSVFAK